MIVSDDEEEQADKPPDLRCDRCKFKDYPATECVPSKTGTCERCVKDRQACRVNGESVSTKGPKKGNAASPNVLVTPITPTAPKGKKSLPKITNIPTETAPKATASGPRTRLSERNMAKAQEELGDKFGDLTIPGLHAIYGNQTPNVRRNVLNDVETHLRVSYCGTLVNHKASLLLEVPD